MSMNKMFRFIHQTVIKIVTDAGLFVFAAFMMSFFSGMDPFLLSKDTLSLLRQYVFIPWGALLCIHRVQQANDNKLTVRSEVWLLFVLWLWLVAPFALRFGVTTRTAYVWNGYGVMFFAVYALTSELDKERREAAFDHAVMMFSIFGWILGVTLLYCAVTVQSFTTEMGNYVYGIYKGMHLVSGQYYNTTALFTLYTALMCLTGMCRGKSLAARLLHGISAAMMIVVTILTQSRTSRYALLAALALGGYGVLCHVLKGRRMLIRQGAAILVGAAVLVGGYVGADWLTEKALIHYVTADAESRTLSLIAPALADAPEDEKKTGTPEPEKAKPVDIKKLKRNSGETTFTGRTKIWMNGIAIWKETPKYMLIGVGSGNSGMLFAKGLNTFEERGGVDAHNAYLQFAVDYGIIGFVLLAVFMGILVVPALRVFYQDCWSSGYGVLVMLVVAALLVGMMESDTFGALSAGGTMLFFALALLAARGREIQQSGDKGSER